ncbi:hypothetical protein LWI28_005975 [Acer negundo]|uniref:Uncharacterized protein n=1 Tax=Acer negundo TaxID=4023 RepID=A0AAD5IIJ5_ACENE|nr:hypothetical protein LWI28_005975 [Acer negundo]
MADENQDREENQNVTENVNVPEAKNQPKYVNVAENVAEADNLAVDFVGKEYRAEPSSKQLHKKKQKWYHGPDELIKRQRNLFDASPRMRTTRHVHDRPDLEPPPLDETNSPLRHLSLRGTQTGLSSSGDNHRTSSPTHPRQPPPLPPPVDCR